MMTYWENERRKLLGLPLIADTGKSGTALDAPDSAVKKQAGEEEAPPFALNPEEEKHQSKKLTGENANAYEGHLQQFKQWVDAAKSPEELLSVCELSASLLFEEATKSYADGNLYFSRLKMRVFLKKNFEKIATRLKIINVDEMLNRCLQSIEATSRNWNGINWGSNSAQKKILISGFDPFQEADTNFSGELALRFHNKELTSSDGTKIGLIQAAIFPVLYSEFDAGIVEHFFSQHIGYVDAILTCSLDGNLERAGGYFAIERFAANWRDSANSSDNFGKKNPPSKKISSTPNNYLEDSLPTKNLVFDSEVEKTDFILYRQKYTVANDTIFQELKKREKTLEPPTGAMLKGSGGAFLSNEIFYRVAKLREEMQFRENARQADDEEETVLPTGHIHVPKVSDPRRIAIFETLLKRLIDAL